MIDAYPKRRAVVAAVVAVLAVLGTLFVAAPAQAAGGAITGRVYLATYGTPAGAGDVTLSVYATGTPTVVAQSVTTDATGAFTFSGLTAAAYRLVLDYTGTGPYLAHVEYPFDVAPGGSFLTPGMPAAYVVGGRVALDTAGNYAGAGQVRVSLLYDGRPTITTLTDADGRYNFGRVATSFVIKYEYLGAEDYPDWYYTGDGRGWAGIPASRVTPTSDRTDYNVIVGAGVSIAGRLVTGSGEPWANKTVVVTAEDSSSIYYRHDFVTTTDSNGNYRVRALPNGATYWVSWGDEPDDGIAYGESPNGSIFGQGADFIPTTDQLISGVNGTVYAEAKVTVSVSWPTSLDGAMDHGSGVGLVLIQRWDASTSQWGEAGTFGGSLSTSNRSVLLDELQPGTYRLGVDYYGDTAPFTPIVGSSFALVEGQSKTVSFSLVRTGASVVPQPVAAPTVTGANKVGSLWTVDVGNWTGTPTFAVYWLRCALPIYDYFDVVPFVCTAIPGANGLTYTSTWADDGYWLTAQVAANGGGSFALLGALTGQITFAGLPVSYAPPMASGTATVGSTWTALSGAWGMDPWNGNAVTVGYTWVRCSQPTANSMTSGAPSWCTPIAGATSDTYVATDADAGKYLTVVVTGTGEGGTTYTVAATSGVITAAPPMNTVTPTVSGSAAVGSTWTATRGTWTGATSTPLNWLRCTSPITSGFTTVPAGCSVIAGATSTTYVATASDGGKYLTVQVAGNGAAGYALAGALNSTAIISTVPVNTVAPSVSGAATAGSTWTANTGTWTGSPTFAIYWLRCAAPVTTTFTTVPAGCSAITGATGPTYTATGADAGKYLTVQVAGNGSGGFALAGALNATAIQSTVPVNTVAPTVSGSSTVGSTWTANTGTWTGSPTFAIYWLRCSTPITSGFTTVPAGCSAIAGATGPTYTSTAADAGKYLTVQVAGNGSGGFALAGALNSTVVQSTTPTNTVAPSVSGASSVGSTWTANTGTWTGSPTFAIYWLRCSAPITSGFTTVPVGCSAIPGATGATYTSTSADGGKYLTVQVAGNGASGFALAGALNSTAIVSTVPTNTVAPSVSGASAVGSTWTANTGSWTGSPTFAIYWLRCSAPITSGFTTVPAGCSAIPGATGPSYTATTADGGKYLTVQVAGNGASGFALAGALNSTAIVSTAPTNTVPPTVAGVGAIGSTWTATTGTWTGSPTIAVYWLRCSSPVTSTFTTVPGGCAVIPGATSTSYATTAADSGKYLTVQVAGNGSTGFALSGAISTAPMDSLTAAPTNTAAPTVSGASAVGSVWTATTGTWTGSPTIATYWLRCSAPITSGFTTVPAGCSAIPGATGTTYTSTAADTGKYLTVQVAGNGSAGFALAGALNSTATG